MDAIESIKNDKVYLKCKKIVKIWERDFKAKYSRTPSKFDIKEAPSKIKYAYKKYFQLKSTALENSLCIDNFNDDLSIFVASPNVSPESTQQLEHTFHSASPQSDQTLPTLPSGQELEKLLSNVKNINTDNESLSNPPISFHPFTENLSKKLFHSRKFSLRNPRKLPLPKSQSAVVNKGDGSIDKENNINNLLNNTTEKSIEIDTSSTISQSTNNHTYIVPDRINRNLADPVDQIKSSQLRQLDLAWLERAAGVSIQESEKSKQSKDSIETFGLTNITILNTNPQCDYVENSESEEELTAKIKPILKKRKCDVKLSAIKDIQANESLNKYETVNFYNPETSDTNKFELNKKQKSKRKTKTNNKTEECNLPDITEYLPFGLEENVLPRHSNVDNVLCTVQSAIKTGINEEKNANKDDKIEKKIRDGTLNDNFVKINIEKKVFVRGKKSFNFSKYKKQQWKNKKALHAGMEFPETGKISCFKCGATGHMARYCSAHKGDALLPLESYEECELPSLEDLRNVICNSVNSISQQPSNISTHTSYQIPDYVMKLLTDVQNNTDVQPIFSNYPEETQDELIKALHKFGHESFRPGQECAIKRILSGMSTLLILSTGGGKSLCYQIPAYIYSQHYKCITLVISPLVSLMEDQVLSMPEFLRAGCLHTNQPPTQRRKIMQCLKDGEINVLLISPEALISGDTSNGFSGLFKSLPQIAFACIDEAHCVSQWSHNFRPSYLMICRILREKLNVKCILGLTATASQSTIKSVISHLNVPDGMNGVITNPSLPENLYLSVSIEREKDKALVSYLATEKISSFNSIIIYCIRRDECERVAALLRSCLQEPGKINMEKQCKKRKKMSYIAEAYHAGMSAAQRKKIQKHFMDGTLRIIVATVAFGMGINKSDIRCIIHYNMPSSFESYVQEVGRAGRDGESAYCHVFMNNNNSDKNELLKHIHTNSIDRPTIRKLLKKVFIPCECSKTQDGSTPSTSLNNSRCSGHEIGIPIDNTVEELDLPSENIATLLCYIELHPKHYIKVLNNAYIMCKILSYGGPQTLLQAAKSCPPLAMAYLLQSKKDPNIMNKSVIEFNVIEVAAAIGWQSGITKYQLKNLEWMTDNGATKRSQLKVELNTLGFRIKASGDLTPTELDCMLDDLHKCVLSQEKANLYQLEECFKAFTKLGNYSVENNDLLNDVIVEKSNELKSIIKIYFEREHLPEDIKLEERPLDTDRAMCDVRALISTYKDCDFTGRSIARIFQGISSPNYSAIVWSRCKFWRSHIHEDFYGLIKVATQQIIQMKIK